MADIAVWLGLFAFMLQAGAYEAGRLALPFYVPLLAPLLRRPGWGAVVRRKWWKVAAVLALLYTAGILIISRGRPLLPWRPILSTLHRLQPASPAWPRAAAAYEAHLRRADLFAGVRAALPPEEHTIGFVGNVARVATLWLPFGSRFVSDIIATDTLESIRARGIRVIVMPVDDSGGLSPEEEVQRDALERAGTVLQRVEIESTLTQERETWLVLRLP